MVVTNNLLGDIDDIDERTKDIMELMCLYPPEECGVYVFTYVMVKDLFILNIMRNNKNKHVIFMLFIFMIYSISFSNISLISCTFSFKGICFITLKHH